MSKKDTPIDANKRFVEDSKTRDIGQLHRQCDQVIFNAVLGVHHMGKLKTITMTEFLDKIAPDFMWCSMKDLFLMYEQIDEDVCFFSFGALFYKKATDGWFDRKVEEVRSGGGRKRFVFIRNRKVKYEKN